MKGLTPRQQEILDIIRGHVRLHGFPPTIRELAALIGIRSTNGINDHIKALERKGFLRRDRSQPAGKARALVLVDPAAPRQGERVLGAPQASTVRGQPLAASPASARRQRLEPVLAYLAWLESEGRCSRTEADRCREAAREWATEATPVSTTGANG